MNTKLFLIINSLAGQNQWLDRFMVFLADWLGYFMVAVLFVYFFKDRQKYKNMFLISLVSAVVSRFVFVEVIRYFYYNPRPFMVLQETNLLIDYEAKSSFPSGHAAFYFALAMGVYFYNKKSGYIFFGLAGLMGLARIFVGVHWPWDIIVGAILGMATALGVYYVNQVRTKLRPTVSESLRHS